MHIEFFKLEYAHYPDDLQQVLEDDAFAPVTDPLQAIRTNEKQMPFYNYEKTGEHYVLYSSGADGIAGTKDDFYPDVRITDSTKIGLLLKH